jgi:mitogen-activated protein kinase 1/3
MDHHLEKKEKKQTSNPNKQTSIERQIKWSSSKHTFTVSGTKFVVDERYEYIKQIGLGAYGVVCSCYDKKENRNVAIKKVGNAFEDLVDAKRIVREIKLLRYFDHDNIVSLYDIPKPPSRTGFNDIYIISDLMETDLHRVIYSRQDLTDDHIQYFIYQILRGVLYMHSANIIHRDLKPANILANKNCDLKICDLGLGRGEVRDEEDDEKKEELTEYVITRWYRAPEVILCPSEYSKAVDIWSIGCIFAELLGRQPLFPGDHYLDQIQKIISVLGTPKNDDLEFITKSEAREFLMKLVKRTKQTWSSLFPNSNPVALDLLGKMLTFNPKKRYTVDQCISHPYFEGLHDPEQEPITSKVFDWSFDSVELTKENLQNMIYEESLYFHREDE